VLFLALALFTRQGEAAEPAVGWRLDRLLWEIVSGDEGTRARWRHSIVLLDQRGVGITFSRLEESRWTVGGASTAQVASRSVTIRVPPNGNAVLTVEDALVFARDAEIVGRADRLLIGRDDQGQEVRVFVMIPLLGAAPRVPQSPASIPGPPETPRSEPGRVPFRGGVAPGIVVGGLVNGGHEVTLLVDTGATNTILSPRALARFGIQIPANAPQVSFAVAGGQRRDAQVVRLDSLEVGSARLGPLDVLAFDVSPESPALDGLVGLDFLNQFTVTIDHASGHLVVAPKEEKGK
jgi:clan AA aspartic protease (TIGR02281 family)